MEELLFDKNEDWESRVLCSDESCIGTIGTKIRKSIKTVVPKIIMPMKNGRKEFCAVTARVSVSSVLMESVRSAVNPVVDKVTSDGNKMNHCLYSNCFQAQELDHRIKIPIIMQ